jgi:hypothetical protein
MNSGWNDRFVQAAKRQARWSFRKLPREEREELTNDVVSVAWEFFNAWPDKACPTSAARYAVRRVKSGRQLQESNRSITGPVQNRLGMPRRSVFEPEGLTRYGDNPAVIAEFMELYRLWFGQLNARQQQAVKLLAAGYRAVETAEQVGVTQGRVSQIRREAATLWDIINM